MRGLSSVQRFLADFSFEGATGTILSGFGAISVVRNAEGDWTVTLDELVGSLEVNIQIGGRSTTPQIVAAGGVVAGVFGIIANDNAGAAVDVDCSVQVTRIS